MDGFTIDHSDSDSGDSWTILYNNSTGDDAPDIAENKQILKKVAIDSNTDKDDDTDGISIISDSEPEVLGTNELIQDLNIKEDSHPAEIQDSEFITVSPIPHNDNDIEESIRCDDDLLGNNTGKQKTYVHRRNKRLSTVLNIIMLGSVITAAGVAFGHMWGARNECTMPSTPSINKILSNLYKLQEENTYLRNKLKELTVINSLQMQQKKFNSLKSLKPQRCKKIFEEPLGNKNTDGFTKCIDYENYNVIDNNVDSHLLQADYEKSFSRDVEKLKHIYQQNRSWLDQEVSKRMKFEEDNLKKKVKKSLSRITEEQKVQDDGTKPKGNAENDPLLLINNSSTAEKNIQWELDFENNSTDKHILPARRITYADSLKSDHRPQRVAKREVNSNLDKAFKKDMLKKKIKKNEDVMINDSNISEEELRKDDRYIGHKYKQEKKKRDRQKLHKKQKRRNKYEQWEMKGGYMQDFDDFSTASVPDRENILKNVHGKEFENTHINQIKKSDSIQIVKSDNKFTEKVQKVEKVINNSNNEDANWYDKRAALRTEARKKLEYELFGETSPHNAGWYFRRMQKREQCRTKGDNSTYKKLYKRNMNFKTKQ